MMLTQSDSRCHGCNSLVEREGHESTSLVLHESFAWSPTVWSERASRDGLEALRPNTLITLVSKGASSILGNIHGAAS